MSLLTRLRALLQRAPTEVPHEWDPEPVPSREWTDAESEDFEAWAKSPSGQKYLADWDRRQSLRSRKPA